MTPEPTMRFLSRPVLAVLLVASALAGCMKYEAIPDPVLAPRDAKLVALAPQPTGGFDHYRARYRIKNPTSEAPGTVVVDAMAKFLYLVEEGGTALRYPISVGADAYAWSGEAVVGRKAEWPSWTPMSEARKLSPGLPAVVAGGPTNPFGARALYLYEGGKDTYYRIHGTNEPDLIGQNVSLGCIRMQNVDVIDLYERVGNGARVVVR